MQGIELIGLAGGAITTAGFVPQVWQVFRSKSAEDVSLSFILMFLVGIGFWFAYGLAQGLFSVILWNAITLVLTGMLLYGKLRYGLSGKRSAIVDSSVAE